MVKNRIRELREENNLTLKGLSHELKSNGHPLSASSLIKYERGERNPSLETWQKLAKFFNVPVPYLQGQGPSVEQAKNKIINLLHERYFDGQLSQVVDGYLKAIRVKIDPFNFYSDDEEEFIINEPVKAFWKQYFGFVFKYDTIVDVLFNFNLFNENKIVERLESVIEKENLKQLPENSLFKIYNNKYPKRLFEAEFNLNSAIRLGEKDDIKQAIEDYQNVLTDLKHDLL